MFISELFPSQCTSKMFCQKVQLFNSTVLNVEKCKSTSRITEPEIQRMPQLPLWGRNRHLRHLQGMFFITFLLVPPSSFAFRQTLLWVNSLLRNCNKNVAESAYFHLSLCDRWTSPEVLLKPPAPLAPPLQCVHRLRVSQRETERNKFPITVRTMCW